MGALLEAAELPDIRDRANNTTDANLFQIIFMLHRLLGHLGSELLDAHHMTSLKGIARQRYS